ncbi:hypothetical protein [Micromonospora inositola]|uniref:Integral membrane protein n=1 Tax=Micromonospora inositola TaxID=47865 RepID=A0A1C5JXE4_9ACTN|nr:hypothetical protein [Micromonospora inositola]SCG75001.1 hypothetical protein GA0070613_5670 [Micromonospora inositola]
MSVRVTELRVHGVSGDDADAMLDRPLVFRVAGDRNAGFYRPRPGYGATTGPGGVTLEAYHWSNLTAGTAVRTLSLLLLLPFMLSNLAIWMLPNAPQSRTDVTAKALCRLLAATITAMYVLSFVGVSLDLVAWECASYPRCLEGRRYLSWLGGIPPGQRLALLALAPIAVVGLAAKLGSRSWRSSEPFTQATVRAEGNRLDAPGYWAGMPLLRRLRSIHIAVALATVDTSLLAALAPIDGAVTGHALVAAAVMLLVACLVLLCVPVTTNQGSRGARVETTARAIHAAAGVLTALCLVYAATRPAERPVTGSLPGYDSMVAWIFLGQAALLIALGAVVLWQRRGRPTAPTLLGDLGAPAVIAVAIGLALEFTAGLVYRVADFLDRGSLPSPLRPLPAYAPQLQPPVSYRWLVLGFGAAVLLAILVELCWSRLTLSRRRRAAAEVVARDFPDPPAQATPRLRDVRDAVAKARVTERLRPMRAAYPLVAVFSLGSAGFALAGIAPGELAARLGGERARAVVDFATDLGAYLVGLFVVGLAVAGLLAYRSPAMRLVGVLWDLATFWPRAAHPFAPPCYAERVVPDLVRRTRYLAEQGGVLLSGHSHGSALLAATILQLPPETLRRVALLTYGSPLHPVYARLFPAYVSDDTLREVGDRVGWRWLNLWRDTDPIGGWIFSPHRLGERPAVNGPPGGVDRRLRDPRDVTLEPSDTVPPPIEGHSQYHADEQFDAAVREQVAQLVL